MSIRIFVSISSACVPLHNSLESLPYADYVKNYIFHADEPQFHCVRFIHVLHYHDVFFGGFAYLNILM